MKVGTPIQEKTAEIWALFAPVEGYNHVYFGKVRNGKTYSATADILELLKRGEIVYANWRINFDEFDERNSFRIALVKYFFGKKYFYKFSKDNFYYIDTNAPDLVQTLNKLVGVHVFIDEGQWIFNSHLKTDDPDKRRLILEGGHYCRSLNVITQRPINILKDIRSQINIWYKVEKRFTLFGRTLFARYQIEDMKDDVPVEPFSPEGKLLVPVKHYWAKQEVFNAYATHAMRREDAIYIDPVFEVFETTYFERLALVYSFLIPKSIKSLTRKISAGGLTLFYEKKRDKLRLDKHNIIPKTLKQPNYAYKLTDIKKIKRKK